MIVLPETRAPPAVGLNTTVALTLFLKIARSEDAIENGLKPAAPPILPDITLADAVGSTLVATETLPPAVGVSLMMRPVTVTVTAVLASIA